MMSETSLCKQIQLDPQPESWSDSLSGHAATCPHCLSFLETLSVMQESLRSLPAVTAKLPDHLREQMLNSLNDATEPQLEVVSGTCDKNQSRPHAPRRSLRFLVPLATAAVLLLGVVLEKQGDITLSGMGETNTEVPATMGQYISDVTHDHYLLERIARPLEVAITTAPSLSNWLSESLSFEFNLPAQSKGLSLEGGRVWHTVGRLSAMASYRSGDGSRILIFAVPADNLDMSGSKSEMIGETRVFSGNSWGHEGRAWIDGDLAVSLTAPEGHLPRDWAEIFLP